MGETAKVMFCRIHISKKYVKNLSHTGERWTENCPPETSWKRFNKNNLTWQYVLKTCWRHLCRTSWRCLEDFFAKRLEGVLKTSWRRLEDILKTYDQDEYIGLDQDVMKTSWRCLLKTYEQAQYVRLGQDVFWRQRQKTWRLR